MWLAHRCPCHCIPYIDVLKLLPQCCIIIKPCTFNQTSLVLREDMSTDYHKTWHLLQVKPLLYQTFIYSITQRLDPIGPSWSCFMVADTAGSGDGPSSGKQDALEKAEQCLEEQQQQFVARLLLDPEQRQVHTTFLWICTIALV